MNATNLRNWLNRGELEKLENVVLEGRGARLMGEFSPDLRTRIFLKGLPNFLMKITELHDAVVRGSLWEVKRLVESEPRKKLIYAKDPAGTPVIHKAVYYDHQNILDWIVMHFPDVVDLKDREGRTALHYCAACSDPEAVWDTLVDAGCDASVCDKRSNPAAFYLQRGTEIELPDLNRAMASRRNRDSTSRSLEIKPSNIRIWIHNRDIGKLQYVLWEGHGSKLRCETSNNVRVKKFLEAAPYIMVTIKDIHAAVIKNDIDGFKSKLEEPVSPVILCSKDSNGLNVLHKAAGLGYVDMAKEILERYPAIVNSTDNEGRTPLHYASVCRDGGIMYDLLVENGADESKVDNVRKTSQITVRVIHFNVNTKHKNAAHYKSKPAEIDLSSLVMIPEAPRVSGTGYPKGWDWRIIDSDHPLRKRNHANNNSNNNLGDDDSAFGSAESAKLLDDTPETETAEDELNGNNEATDNNEEENPENEINAEENGETTSEDPPENAEDGAEEEPVNPENEEEKLEGEEEKPEDEAEETEKPGEEEENPENEVETADGEEEKLTITEITEEESEPKEEPENDEETIIDANNNETEFTEIEEHNPESDKKESDEDQEQDPADEDTGQEGDLIQLEPQEETEPDKETESADNNDANPELVNVPNEEEQAEEEEDEEEGEPEQEQQEGAQGEDQEVAESEPPATSPSPPPPPPSESPEPQEEQEEEKTEKNEEEEQETEEREESEEVVVNGMAVDEESDELVENGTMEQLAALVLTGEGHRLVGRQSSNPELQAFIDTVPSYMAKIRAVHKAAREGSLKDLQLALDRRRFAIAKDPSSPHGATPLHVAVIFGHTPIIRYLAGRFTETCHALDLDGRTPLHYAATLADNGHYYNLLLNLGANPLVQDNFGHKADYYKKNQEDLSHKQLLRDFGATESLADEMLEDKDEKLFQDEEGRYLASSLGDPLIKGLTEVATTRPKDPVTYLASYLYNFANAEKPKDKQEDPNILIIPENRENGHQEESRPPMQNGKPRENENDDGYPQSPDLDTPDSLFAETERDENGQSSLHFAANRSHSKDGLYHLLQERQINVAYRDSRYRTARDVAEQSRNRENVQEIDRFVVYLAARGETDKLVELLMEGYDHILDAEDDGRNILEIAEEENNQSTVKLLQTLRNYTELRDDIHGAIRAGDTMKVRELLEMNGDGARLLALGKNMMGRCSLHVAVLREHPDIVRYLAKTYPETLRIGDNLERTPLHYAMGVPSVEIMSNILIKAGAKRVTKDLRSRQPTYYFMNKTDIKHLQDEEASMDN